MDRSPARKAALSFLTDGLAVALPETHANYERYDHHGEEEFEGHGPTKIMRILLAAGELGRRATALLAFYSAITKTISKTVG